MSFLFPCTRYNFIAICLSLLPHLGSWKKFYGSGKWATDDLTFVFKFNRPRASTTSFIATVTFDSTHSTAAISVPRCQHLSQLFSFECRFVSRIAYLLALYFLPSLNAWHKSGCWTFKNQISHSSCIRSSVERSMLDRKLSFGSACTSMMLLHRLRVSRLYSRHFTLFFFCGNVQWVRLNSINWLLELRKKVRWKIVKCLSSSRLSFSSWGLYR